MYEGYIHEVNTVRADNEVILKDYYYSPFHS